MRRSGRNPWFVYPTKRVQEARALAARQGHLFPGRFLRIPSGLSFEGHCARCGLELIVLPASPWETPRFIGRALAPGDCRGHKEGSK